MERTEYNNCMKPYISGQHEDRKMAFCIGAKMCTGKAKNEKEAEQICLAQPPKEPKPRKTRGGAKLDVQAFSACILPKIAIGTCGDGMSNVEMMKIVAECAGSTNTKVEKVENDKKFLKKCVKEATAEFEEMKGRAIKFQETAPLIKMCQLKLKDKKMVGVNA